MKTSPTDTPRRRASDRRIPTDWLIVVVAVLLTIITLGTMAAVVISRRDAAMDVARTAYAQDIQKWHESLGACARGKLDRTVNATAFRAQSTYLNLVLDAASVKADVKRAARRAQAIFDDTADELESRTGIGLDCRMVYPKPPTPAGVKTLP